MIITKTLETYLWFMLCENEGYKNAYVTGVPVAHTRNPSYSGGRDQEDHGSKPVRNSSWEPISKTPNIRKGSTLLQVVVSAQQREKKSTYLLGL
jgi:hypothetical protein